MNEKNSFIQPMMERSEREKMGKHFFDVILGAFEMGYELGIADERKRKEKKK